MSIISSGSLDYAPTSPGAQGSAISNRNLRREYDKKAMEYHEKIYD